MDQMTLTLVSGSGVALAAAIGALWKTVIKTGNESRERHNKDQERHEKTQDELLEVTKQVGMLQGKVSMAEGINPKLESIESLAQQTLDTITQQTQ